MNIHYEFNSHEIITILQLLLGDKYIAKYIYSLKNKSENNDALIYHKSLRRSYNMIESSLISQCSDYIPLSCDIPVSYETWILIRDLKVDILCFFENFICSYQRSSHEKILLSTKDKIKILNYIRKSPKEYIPNEIKYSIEEFIYYHNYPHKNPSSNNSYLSNPGCFYFEDSKDNIILI